ncbi:MAG: hypothetical protein M1828_001720 [Chrysothrix sp. TS-e1954]|nr:MAG: hypothetical protein M1828_001720 [Chrysothrix sp. TS-e1954]
MGHERVEAYASGVLAVTVPEDRLTSQGSQPYQQGQTWCEPCRRQFASPNNLHMHLNSKVHRGCQVVCRFCKRGFTTASGLAHHLEAKGCPNAQYLDRSVIFDAIRQMDSGGVITNKLLAWKQESNTWSTENAWNYQRSVFECYFCHKGFKSTKALDAHLQSPVHSQKIYHCPDKAGCGMLFKSLAGLFNHWESESCGYVKFEILQENVHDFMFGKQRAIGFH